MDRRRLGGGIGGIERKIQLVNEATDRNIDAGFQDLKNLMTLIEDMVNISKSIKDKLQEKGNDISEDETVLFKSYLLSLGVNENLDSQVKRSHYNSDSKYYKDLAKQIASVIKPIARSKSGHMAMTEVYCAINRARGFDLISPDDLINACSTLDKQNLGLKMITYPSGLIVLQCEEFDENYVNNQILNILEECESVSAQELAIKTEVSVALARQHLLNSEKVGLVCRDESIQGLRFYSNKFMAWIEFLSWLSTLSLSAKHSRSTGRILYRRMYANPCHRIDANNFGAQISL